VVAWENAMSEGWQSMQVNLLISHWGSLELVVLYPAYFPSLGLHDDGSWWGFGCTVSFCTLYDFCESTPIGLLGVIVLSGLSSDSVEAYLLGRHVTFSSGKTCSRTISPWRFD
jgi:hypothetical protein